MRRLFTIVSILSLMLFIGVGVIWVRSYRTTDTLHRESRQYSPASRRAEDSLTSDVGGLRIRHILWSYNANAAPKNWSPKSETSIRIRPGDNLRITLLDLMSAGQETVKITRANPAGDIALPYLGMYRVQGRTPAQVVEMIRDEYDAAMVVQNVQLVVNIIAADGSDEAIVTEASEPAAGASWTLAHDSSSASLPVFVLLSSLQHRRWHLLGFEFHSANAAAFTHAKREWSFVVPDWALCLLFGVGPTISLLRLVRRRQRVKTNRCTSCGYDLRATPWRCPECGKEVRQRTSEAAVPHDAGAEN